MNISLNIGMLNIVSIDSKPLAFENEIANVLLSPFYATEEDVIKVFADEIGDYRSIIQKIIFEGSIEADRLFRKTPQSARSLSNEDIFYFKRKYTICYSVYNFGNVFHKDYKKSYNKQKFLADLKVSVDIDRDPFLIKQISEDAKQCMAEIVSLSQDHQGFGMTSFVKGRSNKLNDFPERNWPVK